jgi:hypothetical protein
VFAIDLNIGDVVFENSWNIDLRAALVINSGQQKDQLGLVCIDRRSVSGQGWTGAHLREGSFGENTLSRISNDQCNGRRGILE